MLHIVTSPVDELTAVPVPGVILETPYVFIEAVVKTKLPLLYTSSPTHNAPPIPTPPVTTNEPVEVLVAEVELVILIAISVEFPKTVTVCKLAVLQTVTSPVDVLTAVPVPDLREVTT